MIGHLVHAAARQHTAKIRRSHKARLQMVEVLFQLVQQSLPRPVLIFLRAQPHVQNHHIGRHRIHGKSSGLCEIFLHKGGMNFSRQLFIPCRILGFAQKLCCFVQNRCREVVVPRCDQPCIRSAEHAARIIAVQREPVSVVLPVEPQALSAVQVILLFHVFHPAAHALVLTPQNALIAGMQVNIPRNDGCRIAPGRRCPALIIAQRCHIRHRAAKALLPRRDISAVFCIKGIRVHEIAGRSGEDLRIACPAVALVSLRTIGGNVEKIVLHPPFGIVNQLIHQLIRGAKAPDLLHIRMDFQATEVLGIRLSVPSRHLDIAIAVKRKMLPHEPLGPVCDIGEFRLGRAQIVAIEIAVLQDFTELEEEPCPLRCPADKLQPSHHVLSHVQNRFSGRCMDDLHGTDSLMYRDARRKPRIQSVIAKLDVPHAEGLARIQRRIIDFPRINPAVYHPALSRRPGLIGSDDLLRTVLVPDMDLRQCRQTISIVLGRLSQSVPALVPAVSQHNLQKIAPLRRCQLKGLVLDPGVIAAESRQQALLPLFFSVEIELVYAKTDHIRSGALHRLIDLNPLLNDRLHFLRKIRCDPLPLPRGRASRNGFGGFKILYLTPGAIPCLVRSENAPVIPGQRLQLHRQLKGNARELLLFSAVIQGRIKIVAQRHLHSCRLLPLSPRLCHHIGNRGMLQIISHRIDQVIHLQMLDSHLFPSIFILSVSSVPTPSVTTKPCPCSLFPHRKISLSP